MTTLLRLHQINDVKLVGRLTRDPDVRYTPKGQAVCRLDLAVNRRYKDSMGEWKDDTSFIPVVVWREAAERCRERLKKGSPVYVEGRLKSRNWETKEGQKRSSLEVEALRIQFLERMVTQGASAPSPVDEEGDMEVGGVPDASKPMAEGEAAARAGSGSLEDDVPF